MIQAAIYEALSEDATLVALLSSYDPIGNAEGAGPGLFDGHPVPEDAVYPYGVLAGIVSNEEANDDNDGHRGREVLFDVGFYDDRKNSSAAIDQIAERARIVLHRQPLDVDGFVWVDTKVSGPVNADDIDVHGRVLTLRILLDQS